MEWSGWSSVCCAHADQTARRVRIQANECTGVFQEKYKPCEILDIDVLGLQTCQVLMGFKTGYTEIEYVEIERPIVWTQQREVINVGYDVNYGRLISQGLYSINGVTYELSYNGQEQVWLIVNADGSKSPVAVETYKYHNGMRNVYYYNFGGVWHQYLNNQFSYTQTPPFYTTGYTAPTTSYYGQ